MLKVGTTARLEAAYGFMLPESRRDAFDYSNPLGSDISHLGYARPRPSPNGQGETAPSH